MTRHSWWRFISCCLVDCCCLCWLIFFAKSSIYELVCSLDVFHEITSAIECVLGSTLVSSFHWHVSFIFELPVSRHDLGFFLWDSVWIVHQHLEFQWSHVLGLLEASTNSVGWLRGIPSFVCNLHYCLWTELWMRLFNSASGWWHVFIYLLICNNLDLIHSYFALMRCFWMIFLRFIYWIDHPLGSQVI